MKEKLKEIEVVTTVEITHIMREDDLEALGNDIPTTPEELAEWKEGIADSFKGEIMNALLADAVNVTDVQVFMKEENDTVPLFPETDEKQPGQEE